MRRIFLLLPMLVLWSCQEEEISIPVEDNASFTAYPKGYFIQTREGVDTIKFEYNSEKKVIKRVGEWLELSGSTGFGNIFSKKLESRINYSGNKAILERFSKMEGINFPKDIQTYSFDGNRINDIIFTYQIRPNYTEKYVYTYENNQIKSIDLRVTDSHYTNDLRSRRDFYFNNNGNLDSLVYREASYDFYDESIPPYIDYKLKNRRVTTFSNYDGSQNPFQNLGIFTDLYYKSLSKNNFRKMETIKYDEDGEPTLGISESSWDYQYQNGEVKVLK